MPDDAGNLTPEEIGISEIDKAAVIKNAQIEAQTAEAGGHPPTMEEVAVAPAETKPVEAAPPQAEAPPTGAA